MGDVLKKVLNFYTVLMKKRRKGNTMLPFVKLGRLYTFGAIIS